MAEAVAADAAEAAAVSFSYARLGAGLSYRRELRAEIFAHRTSFDCLELVADHFFESTALRELDLLGAHFPLLVHGLDLSLGSADGCDAGYLKRLARVVEHAGAAWWSEHIAFTQAGGIRFGHLAPLPFTNEALDTVCRNVERAQRRINAPLMLENISSALELPGEMPEAEFVSAIAERTGCGLLLDVTNLYTNAMNRGFTASDYLEQIPRGTPVQLHFAGGFWDEGELIDSHSEPTPEPVWDVLRAAVERFDVRAMILERDDNLPPIEDLIAELERARSLGTAALCRS
jgi:uncharacterized protein (UPF0276 family)